MKKILFVYHVSTIGGGSYCLLNLLKAVDREYFVPVVLLPTEGPLCEEIDKLGIEIIYYPTLILYPYNQSLFCFSSIKTLINISKCKRGFEEIIRGITPDIIYFNSMMCFPYLKSAKKVGCKTIIHIREHWPLKDHRVQLGWIRNQVYNYSDQVIAINHYSASLFPRVKSKIVYDWIDMEARRGGPTLSDVLGEDANRVKVYLFTGGLQPIKGTIEVLSVFTQTIKGDDRRLLVLGVDPTVDWNGVKGRIKFMLSKIGYHTYKEKVAYLCNNDKRIKCAPSLYNITDIMEKVAGNISFFTIPHANLALAEGIILHVPSVAAKTDESLEYSNGSSLALLYEFGNLELFRDVWKRLDSGETDIKQSLLERANVVEDMFSPMKNKIVFDAALKEIY